MPESTKSPAEVLADAARPFACVPIFADEDEEELELFVTRADVIRLCRLAGVDPHIGYLELEARK